MLQQYQALSLRSFPPINGSYPCRRKASSNSFLHDYREFACNRTNGLEKLQDCWQALCKHYCKRKGRSVILCGSSIGSIGFKAIILRRLNSFLFSVWNVFLQWETLIAFFPLPTVVWTLSAYCFDRFDLFEIMHAEISLGFLKNEQCVLAQMEYKSLLTVQRAWGHI